MKSWNNFVIDAQAWMRPLLNTAGRLVTVVQKEAGDALYMLGDACKKSATKNGEWAKDRLNDMRPSQIRARRAGRREIAKIDAQTPVGIAQGQMDVQAELAHQQKRANDHRVIGTTTSALMALPNAITRLIVYPTLGVVTIVTALTVNRALEKNDENVVSALQDIAAKNPELVQAGAQALTEAENCISQPVKCMTGYLPPVQTGRAAPQIERSAQTPAYSTQGTNDRASNSNYAPPTATPVPQITVQSTTPQPLLPTPESIAAQKAVAALSEEPLYPKAAEEAQKLEDNFRWMAKRRCEYSAKLKRLEGHNLSGQPLLQEEVNRNRNTPLPKNCNADGTLTEKRTASSKSHSFEAIIAPLSKDELQLLNGVSGLLDPSP